jgi:hypothetical protein
MTFFPISTHGRHQQADCISCLAGQLAGRQLFYKSGEIDRVLAIIKKSRRMKQHKMGVRVQAIKRRIFVHRIDDLGAGFCPS